MVPVSWIGILLCLSQSALIVLFVLVIAGIVPADRAFAGFAHPAVVTVAAVLIISRALADSGLIDLASSQVIKLGKSVVVQIVSLTVLTAVASAFMNNVGALAIVMPVALHIARKSSNPPSYILMPIAFGSLLGGMTTLIGTPPSIIIAAFRADQAGEPFGMFAFSPVGVGVAALVLVLSNVVNNAATVVLMAPIGVGLASGLSVSVDPFLMAIAVGASSSFLTPIGHQSNTLIMSPGGYKFSDYWRMGLPVSIIVLAAAVPLIMWFWPL